MDRWERLCSISSAGVSSVGEAIGVISATTLVELKESLASMVEDNGCGGPMVGMRERCAHV